MIKKYTGWNYKVDIFLKLLKFLHKKEINFLYKSLFICCKCIEQEAKEVQLLLAKTTHYDYDLQPIDII